MSTTLATLTEAHLAWLRLRRSPATVSYYYHAYQRLGSFIQDRPEKRVNQWGPLVADAYAQWLRDRGVKAITARHYVDCLAALLNWSLKQDYIKKNPLERCTRPAGKAAPVTGFRLQEVEAMLTVCQRTKAPRRNIALLLLLLDTGLRSAEVEALNIADLDLGSNSLIVRHGKGDRSRVATFSDGTAESLRRYLFKEHPDYEDRAAPLFVWSVPARTHYVGTRRCGRHCSPCGEGAPTEARSLDLEGTPRVPMPVYSPSGPNRIHPP